MADENETGEAQSTERATEAHTGGPSHVASPPRSEDALQARAILEAVQALPETIARAVKETMTGLAPPPPKAEERAEEKAEREVKEPPKPRTPKVEKPAEPPKSKSFVEWWYG